jgi:hypothetical protein
VTGILEIINERCAGSEPGFLAAMAARHSGQMPCGPSVEGNSRPQLMQFAIWMIAIYRTIREDFWVTLFSYSEQKLTPDTV